MVFSVSHLIISNVVVTDVFFKCFFLKELTLNACNFEDKFTDLVVEKCFRDFHSLSQKTIKCCYQ